MAEEGFKRKLAAILSADVEGYSRLMDDDEEATVRTLTSYRNAITDLTQQFRGRVVDSPGDNVLAEFSSVVDAVNCAVEIQRELAERNTELPYKRQMQLRIGVNLGDVIEEDGRIYGDGVNIAARVESLAEAGGICISGRAYDQVENKLGLEYENIGEHQVKNITRPIRVYRVLSYPGAAAHRVAQAKESLGKKWRNIAISAVVLIAIVGGLAYWQFYMRSPDIDPASVEKMAFPLPEKPSIAVLPFVNMSEDPKQEYLSDGITEQITSTLSKVPSMFVIARTSTFAYKGKPVKVQQVSQDLGVRYVLEGSVQRSEDRVRITAQLIDAIDGKHMWAQRYDRELKDIFKLQDEITLKIVRAMRVNLTEGEQANIWGRKSPNNVEYIEKTFEALFHTRQFNKESNHKAKQLCMELIKLEPEHWLGYLGLAVTHNTDVWLGTSSSPKESFGKSFQLCKKAISLDEAQDMPHMVIGNIYLLMRKYDLAIEELKRAIALNPNSAISHNYLGQSLAFSGRPEEGIEFIQKGMRLNPFPDSNAILNLAIAYREAGRYEEAIGECKRALKLAPNHILGYIGLSITYALAGRYEDAREAYSEVLRIDPEYSFKKALKIYPYRPERAKVIMAAMQKAGLPLKPQLPLPDKPFIAVLPFDNLSGDPEQEYFADGMTDDLITALSKISGILVISRNSVFTFKGKPVKIQKVAKELGVQYVLEGSIRRAGNTVRVNAQLIDANADHHLWAEKYDGRIEDIFSVQDKITQKIVSALSVKLTGIEQAKFSTTEAVDIDAYELFLKARNLRFQFTPESFAEASLLLKKAVQLDPDYSQAYAELANIYWTGATKGGGFWKALDINYASGRYMAINYLEPAMQNPTPLAHLVAAQVAMTRRQFERAAEEAKKAIELSPSSPEGYAAMSDIYLDTDPKKAIAYAEMEAILDPQQAQYSLYRKGRANFFMKNFEKTVDFMERAGDQVQALLVNPYFPAAHAYLGHEEEANRILKTIYLDKGFKGFPAPPPEHIIHVTNIQNPEMADLLINGLIEAGLPVKPNSYCRLSEGEKLSIEEVKEIVLGKTWTGYLWYWPGVQFWDHFYMDGKNTLKFGKYEENREFGFDEDILYILKNFKGKKIKSYQIIYRNPHGTYDKKNEYVVLDEGGSISFSVLKSAF